MFLSWCLRSYALPPVYFPGLLIYVKFPYLVSGSRLRAAEIFMINIYYASENIEQSVKQANCPIVEREGKFQNFIRAIYTLKIKQLGIY